MTYYEAKLLFFSFILLRLTFNLDLEFTDHDATTREALHAKDQDQ